MKITPLEIRNQQFDKTNFRGYSIEEVDAFLGNLSLEWERIVNESIMLRMQLDMAEKEAAKFREIQMTLIKTLKTAEDTGNMITEQANLQAEKTLQEAASKSEQILTEAYAESQRLKEETEKEIHQRKEGISNEIQDLERNCRTLEHYRNNLLVQLKTLANTTLEHVESFDITIPTYTPEPQQSSAPITPPVLVQMEEPVQSIPEDLEAEETFEEEPSGNVGDSDIPTVLEEEIPLGVVETTESALAEHILANLKAEAAIEQSSPAMEEEKSLYDDFTVITGITPEIQQALIDSGITTYRALSCLPAYKIFEFLHKKGVGNDELDIYAWTQDALALSGGKSSSSEISLVAEEEITPIATATPQVVTSPKKSVVIDYEDRTNTIISNIRANMQSEQKLNGKAKKEGDTSRLEELLKHRKKDQNTGSFFDNL